MYENYVELNNNIVKICDCFTAPEDAGDIRVGEEISRIVRRAFLYRFMSYVMDSACTSAVCLSGRSAEWSFSWAIS